MTIINFEAAARRVREQNMHAEDLNYQRLMEARRDYRFSIEQLEAARRKRDIAVERRDAAEAALLHFVIASADISSRKLKARERDQLIAQAHKESMAMIERAERMG